MQCDPLPFQAVNSEIHFGTKSENEFRVLIKGNSISRHATALKIGWDHVSGMAADCAENDYAHVFCDLLQQAMPEKTVHLLFGASEYDSSDAVLSEEAGTLADLIVLQGGEHSIAEPRFSCYETDYRALLGKLIRFPGPPRIAAMGVWNPRCREEFRFCTAPGHWEKAPVLEAVQQRICREMGVCFVPLSDLGQDPDNTGYGSEAAVRWHPNRHGMRAIADALFSAVREMLLRELNGKEFS